MKPHCGAIALCNKGEVGLILFSVPRIGIFTGLPYTSWRGIHLSPGKFGKPWQSTAPEVLDGATFHMADILESLKHNFDTTEKS